MRWSDWSGVQTGLPLSTRGVACRSRNFRGCDRDLKPACKFIGVIGGNKLGELSVVGAAVGKT